MRPGWIRLALLAIVVLGAIIAWQHRFEYRHDQGMICRINRLTGTVQYYVPGAPGWWIPD